MKTRKIKSLITLGIVFCMLGVLFFSCPLASQDDYGTLVISIPGSSYSRAAVSPAFVSTLSYLINCSGPGNVSRTVKAGASAAIPLLGGYWNISVTVLNAAGEGIGSEEATVYVEKGKTVSLQLPIAIETNHNKITKFEITNPVFTIGEINHYIVSFGLDFGIIDISIPFGTEITDMGFSMIHTGKEVKNHVYPEFIKFQGHFNTSHYLEVIAENGDPYWYTLEAKLELPEIKNSVWPKSTGEDKIWEDFGFYKDLNNPGTSVVHTEVKNPETGNRSMAILFGNNAPLFPFSIPAFIQNIRNLVPEVISETVEDTYVRIKYRASYGMEYELVLAQYGYSGLYYMTIISNAIIPETSWPINSVWRYYGLLGLDQPKDTEVVSVKDIRTTEKTDIAVFLIGGDSASYEYLRNQLKKMMGEPSTSFQHTETETVVYSDEFIALGSLDIKVNLSMVKHENDINKGMIGIQISRDEPDFDDDPTIEPIM